MSIAFVRLQIEATMNARATERDNDDGLRRPVHHLPYLSYARSGRASSVAVNSLASMSAEPEYRPFMPGPFRWRLGLRPLDLADWIQIGADYDREMAEKDAVLAAYPSTVFQVLPVAAEASVELLNLLIDHLVAIDPARFRVDHRRETVTAGGRVFRLDGALHPLDVAGRLVQEDIALLVPRQQTGSGLMFGGGSICFPNRWDLGSKLGLTMAEVHRPVAQLNEQLEEPIDRFFHRLTPERSFWRLGWTVLDTPALYQPVDGTASPGPAAPSPQHLHLRVERETLRRLPRTGAVVFTIRTYVRHLDGIAADPHDATRLMDALREMPPDVADYKGLDELGPMATAWLADVIDTAS